MEGETIGKWLAIGIPGGLGLFFLILGSFLRKLGESELRGGGVSSRARENMDRVFRKLENEAMGKMNTEGDIKNVEKANRMREMLNDMRKNSRKIGGELHRHETGGTRSSSSLPGGALDPRRIFSIVGGIFMGVGALMLLISATIYYSFLNV